MTNEAAAAGESAKSWTVLSVLQWTVDYLASKGVEKARLESEMILADVLGKKRLDLYLLFDRPMRPEELQNFRERVARRARREPVQYILGQQGFYGVNLRVAPGVLIPRPETERLVEEVLCVLSNEAPQHLLDWGTGSGAIALALAAERAQLQVAAVEVSPEALAIAAENFRNSDFKDRIQLFAGDFFAVHAFQDRFHVIVSNPPYIPSAEIEKLQPEVRDFEPHLALDGGADGLAVIRRMLERAPALLHEGGYLFLEIGAEQGSAVTALAEKSGFWNEYSVLEDLTGRPRIFKAQVK